MSAEEEDIELTDEEIAATKLCIRMMIGLLMDMVAQGEGDEAERISQNLLEFYGIEDADLMQLSFSALKKFGEDPLHEEATTEL